MAKRSISDQEISLIKAMLDRKTKNKDIQFYFDRPNRSVNTGRISTIKKGTYSNSASILAASAQDLDQFIRNYEKAAEREPSVEDRVRALFERRVDGRWYLKSGESDQCECKLGFDPKKLSPVIRAIAALSNNKGGYVFFGVADGSFRLEGVSQVFSKTDIVQIVEKVKSHLSPTPVIVVKDIFDFEGRSLGILRVAPHLDRPVIVYRAGEDLNEGEILFRYPGQSARIKFGDLRSLLDERDRRAQLALASAAKRLAYVGTENALVVDISRNVVDVPGKTILIDEKLAADLKFIKSGEFKEEEGAPTLRLIGEVSPVEFGSITKIKVSKEAIFQEAILNEFLKLAIVDMPMQYVQAGLAQSRMWLPIFYYVRMAGITNAEAANEIQSLKVAQNNKKKILIDRLTGTRTSFTKAVTRAAVQISKDITVGKISSPKTAQEVTIFSSGLTAVEKTPASKEVLLRVLARCLAIATKSDDLNAIGAVYKAACRVDEMCFYEPA